VSNSYVGRHRPAAKPSRGRQIIVPVALFSSTVVGGFVVRDAGASELSAEAAAMKNVSNSVAGFGLTANADAVAAATADRGLGRSSRGSGRGEADSILTPEQQAAAERAKAERAEVQAKLDAAAKANAATKAKADAKAKVEALAHRWVKPLSSYTLTSGFGWRWGRMHPAQDLATPTGSTVRALSSGTVIFAGWSTEGYGYKIEIRHWDGTVSWYAHNSRLLVSRGEYVSPGEKIAYSGSTGNSTGPHLHLEIHPGGGAPVSPKVWLAKRGVYL
jgi:murein DD-endopeptidase MepM/ murein hydrolase activator NlpD